MIRYDINLQRFFHTLYYAGLNPKNITTKTHYFAGASNLPLKYNLIFDYSFFIHETRKLNTLGLTLKEAIQQATDFCIDKKIMKEFFNQILTSPRS